MMSLERGELLENNQICQQGQARRMIVQHHAVIATVMHGGWSRQASVIINEEKGEMVWWYLVVESCSYQNNLRIL